MLMISVCMCTYNGQAYLTRQLESILHQIVAPDEVIIYDDASTDETPQILRRFIAEHSLEGSWTLVEGAINIGYTHSFYHAMELCRGDIIFLANQDDVWNERKIALMRDIMEQHPEIAVLSSKYEIAPPQGKDISALVEPSRNRNTGQLTEAGLTAIFKDNWPGMTLVYRREWLNEEYKRIDIPSSTSIQQIPHDYLLVCLATQRHSFYSVDLVLTSRRRHEAPSVKDEHMASKLIRREQKYKELSHNLDILQAMKDCSILYTPEARKYMEGKYAAFHARNRALLSGKCRTVLQAYGRNRKYLGLTEVLGDLMIQLQLKDRRVRR